MHRPRIILVADFCELHRRLAGAQLVYPPVLVIDEPLGCVLCLEGKFFQAWDLLQDYLPTEVPPHIPWLTSGKDPTPAFPSFKFATEFFGLKWTRNMTVCTVYRAGVGQTMKQKEILKMSWS